MNVNSGRALLGAGAIGVGGLVAATMLGDARRESAAAGPSRYQETPVRDGVLGLTTIGAIAGGGAGAVLSIVAGRPASAMAGAAVLAAGLAGAGAIIGRELGRAEAVRADPTIEAEQSERARQLAEERRDMQLESARSRMAEQHRGAFDEESGSIDVATAAERVIWPFDHDEDGRVDLRDGQQMRTDERAARDAMFGQPDHGPVLDKDHSAVSLLSWFNAVDTDDDGFATLAEVTAALTKQDPNGDGSITVEEFADHGFSTPRPIDIGDYEDL